MHNDMQRITGSHYYSDVKAGDSHKWRRRRLDYPEKPFSKSILLMESLNGAGEIIHSQQRAEGPLTQLAVPRIQGLLSNNFSKVYKIR